MSILLEKPLIKAGAGTGKTKSLIEAIYNLFHQFTIDNKREPKLIVCTFTRKASQELKERLSKMALEDFESVSQKEGGFKKAPPLLKYLQSSFLQISTIDGVLNRFLKKYGFFIELSPDFEISYSTSNQKLFDSLAEKFIYDKYFSLLQKFPYPVLRNIFLSYFKNRLQYGNISFYSKNDFKDFREERDKISFFIETEGSLESYFKENPVLRFVDSSKIKDFLKKEECFYSDNFVPVFEELKKAGEEFFPMFLEKKKNSSILDIEDLLLFSYSLLKEKPSVAKSFSEEWDYWFIDEYQDTSWLQEQIIQSFTNFKNVICVGDPGQSIYSFRGADPDVFNRREQKVKESIKRLEVNYRSSAQLIEFYNDFWAKEIFIKFKTPPEKKLSSVKPYLSFFTYDKQSADYQIGVFQTLYCYIQKLKNQGVDYSQIAILSSTNKDIFDTAEYLRNKKLPVVLNSSKNFSQNRLILDSLFLLKFLINPYDDMNLKALLRTPYFRLSDQDLADSSYQYNSSKKSFLSFWSFIKDKYKSALFVRMLKSYLENYKKLGLFESFKQALFDSALMDLSYWQDSTSSSIANLWKLLDLLRSKNFSELELFYELLEQEEDKDHLKSARPCEESVALSLMTIHKSKGLEFEHVILLDFSMDKSSLLAGRKIEELTVFDRRRNKMAVAVPLGGRDKKKVQSYGHELYNHVQNQLAISEKDRWYYVAMTRAKESLAVFFPHGALPMKNSWLKEVDYFSKIKGLLDKDDSSKIWRLNSGVYQKDNYSVTVLSCEKINQNPQLLFNPSEQIEKSQALNTVSVKPVGLDNSCICSVFPEKIALPQKQGTGILQKPNPINIVTLSDMPYQKEMKNNSYSSKDFIQSITQTDNQKESEFSFTKTKNILFKTSLGSQLHFFLQKLFYFPFEKLDFLISSSPFLSKESQEKIKSALIYIKELKEPPVSSFFKTGYSEWPFKFQKENIVLKGQIDLWSWSDREIYLFDYKSAVSKNIKNQLIFYSWILDQMYRPKMIWMYECYPLEERIKKSLYQSQHKALFETWLKSL